MLTELLNNLTADEKRVLTSAGIPAPRISEWKKQKRVPTRSQALMLCAVTGYDFAELEIELAEVEAKKDAESNSLIAGMLRKKEVLTILGNKKAPHMAGLSIGGNGGIRTLDEALHPILP